ncbi:MAG: hypothetical protein LBF78_12855 [Treponema sp.]|jgi:hypothetical protein|nr:hypothetical protein [Treponema sp.]
MIKFEADMNMRRFQNGLRSFAAMLISSKEFRELIEPIGRDMVAEARGRASFTNRTGNLFRHIKFIPTGTGGVFTTRKSLAKNYQSRGAWYAAPVEKGADIKATGKRRTKTTVPGNLKYLIFRINGEWKKVPSVRTRPRPFMGPVYEDYWEGPNAKGYKALSEVLRKKADEHFRG